MDELPVEEYTLGTCFLNLDAGINKVSKKRKKITDRGPELYPFAPKNGVDLSKIKLAPNDLLIVNNLKDNFSYLDDFVAKKLQPHQVHAVKFMFQAVNMMNGNNINGCILADVMGLGKTLSAISLIWAMVKRCKYTNVQRAKKVLVVCPASLLFHWQKEVTKWLGKGTLQMIVCQGNRNEVQQFCSAFRGGAASLMVIGYECCRIHGRSLEGCVDLIICDEGHKIKNRKIKTAEALVAINAPKRIILTGTPIQNSLEEYFTLVDFINPGIFINYRKFKKVYSDCISEGQAVAANIN